MLTRLQIKGFTVQGFPKNGIWLRYVDDFKIDSNTSIDNLENGKHLDLLRGSRDKASPSPSRIRAIKSLL